MSKQDLCLRTTVIEISQNEVRDTNYIEKYICNNRMKLISYNI